MFLDDGFGDAGRVGAIAEDFRRSRRALTPGAAIIAVFADQTSAARMCTFLRFFCHDPCWTPPAV